MSSFVPKYGHQFGPSEDFSSGFPKDYFHQAQYSGGKAFQYHRMELEQAQREREEIERQILFLSSSGIASMNIGYEENPRLDQRYGGGNAFDNRGKQNSGSFNPSMKVPAMSASVVPKYAQRNIAPENGYLNVPATAGAYGSPSYTRMNAIANPYYNPSPVGKYSKPNTSHIASTAAAPPTAPLNKNASQPQSDLPVIKIRGWGNRAPPSGHTLVYEVHFKRGSRHFVPGPRCPPLLTVGEFVITQCTRGENLGVVTEILTMHQLQTRRFEASLIGMEGDEGEGNLSQIVRVASLFERQSLPRKHSDEKQTLDMAVDLAHNKYGLDMNVLDCEYQFDHAKLTIYYTCETRVDFRDLVKELCAILKIRIWMKDVTKSSSTDLNQAALKALATGVAMQSK